MTADKNHLLSDTEIRRFIINGYHRVDSELGAKLHGKVTERMKSQVREKANPGDNILPLIPELNSVLSEPAFTGALTSLLGENYIIMAHRHCHELDNNDDGSGRTSLPYFYHQDAHAPQTRSSHHYPRYLLLLLLSPGYAVGFRTHAPDPRKSL